MPKKNKIRVIQYTPAALNHWDLEGGSRVSYPPLVPDRDPGPSRFPARSFFSFPVPAFFPPKQGRRRPGNDFWATGLILVSKEAERSVLQKYSDFFPIFEFSKNLRPPEVENFYEKNDFFYNF